MIREKEYTEKITRVEVDGLNCDLCSKNLLKDLKNDEMINVCTFNLSAVSKEEIKQGKLSDSGFYQESSQLCEKCYKTLKDVATRLGGKLPSQFYSLDKAHYEDLLERLADDECDA